MDGFRHVFRLESGRLWHGSVRAGLTGWAGVCLTLDGLEEGLFHDSAKIRAGAAGGYFVKRYNLPGWFTQFRRLFKVSRPAAVRRGAAHLEKIGIATPRVLASLAAWRVFRRREYLITSMMAADDRLLDKVAESESADAVWRLLTGKLLPAVVRLHDSGAEHGDLSLRNCFLSAAGGIGMIDLDGMKLHRRPLTARRRERESARMVSSFLKLCRPDGGVREYAMKAVEEYNALSETKLSAERVAGDMEHFLKHSHRRSGK